MNSTAPNPASTATQFFSPSLRLQPYILCYWLSPSNQSNSYPILPDGCIDLVFELRPGNAHGMLYGTTTHIMDINIRLGTPYLGIRFQAGQGRHFIKAATVELTNQSACASVLLSCSIQPVIEQITEKCHYPEMTFLLNQYFENCLSRYAPVPLAIDNAIRKIEQVAGNQRVQTILEVQALSSRQMQRLFKQHVGVTAKQYAAICRFQYAINLIMHGNSLVNTAIDAGFSDQSHFNHDIRKLTGLPPQKFFQQHVVFLQDQQ